MEGKVIEKERRQKRKEERGEDDKNVRYRKERSCESKESKSRNA